MNDGRPCFLLAHRAFAGWMMVAGFDENAFLDLLYGAALEPARWVDVLERLADLVGGSSATLSRFDLTSGRGPVITARSDPSVLTLYNQHFAACNPLNNVADPRGYVRRWRARILTDEDWMPKAEFVRSEYYNDFFRRFDRHSVMMIRLALVDAKPCAISIDRPRSRDQFDSHAVDLAARVHQHLIRAFDLGCKLGDERASGVGVATVFEESAHGLFLLDGKRHVLRLNRMAERLIADDRGLAIGGRRLIATQAQAARRLDALIAAAASPDAEVRVGGSMSLPSPGRVHALSAIVAPLRGPDAEAVFAAGPRVLVCVTDLEAAARFPEPRLRALFGLTPAEARLALALLEGDTPAEAAVRLGVSANTIRVHLARIFDKTGVNRQSALLALLMRCAAPTLGQQPEKPLA